MARTWLPVKILARRRADEEQARNLAAEKPLSNPSLGDFELVTLAFPPILLPERARNSKADVACEDTDEGLVLSAELMFEEGIAAERDHALRPIGRWRDDVDITVAGPPLVEKAWRLGGC